MKHTTHFSTYLHNVNNVNISWSYKLYLLNCLQKSKLNVLIYNIYILYTYISRIGQVYPIAPTRIIKKKCYTKM